MVYIESLAPYIPHVRIDIEGDIIKFNGKELDNKSRKNVASDLRYLIPESVYYRFKQGIALKGDEKLVVTILGDDIKKIRKIETNNIIETVNITDNMTDEINNAKVIKIDGIDIERKRGEYKNLYKNVKLCYAIRYGEEKCYLKEGCRYLSLEETHHIIDLIHKPEGTAFGLDLDLHTDDNINGG